MTKFVALFGVSSNPATKAHLDIAKTLLQQLKADEVWIVVSAHYPGKPLSTLAPFEDRVAMAEENVKGYPGLIVKDFEDRYMKELQTDALETSTMLKRLFQDHPDTRFAFAMGADNFIGLHTWGGSDFIMKHCPIILIPREGYTDKVAACPCATMLSPICDPSDTRWQNGYCCIKVEENNINATFCREQLGRGEKPDCMRPEVINYAFNKGLYLPTKPALES